LPSEIRMPDPPHNALALAAIVGSGLIAGVFFAFSSFVMPALRRVPSAHGAAAMQAINVVVINPVFLSVFVGTAVLSAIAIVDAILRWDRPGAIWLLVGSVLYLIGTLGVTMAGNVPLNDRLAKVDAAGTDVEAEWAHFLPRWTAWNHVRAVAATLATAAFAISSRG
jgi:uncharacterized membrane protein